MPSSLLLPCCWRPGGILLLRQWLNNEELVLVLPCALAAIGTVLFGFGLFFPVGMFAEDKCSPDQSEDSNVTEDVSVHPSEP